MGEITRATVVTALGMGVARAVGLAREIMVAALFGVSGQMDVWVVTFTLIGVPSAIVMNALQTALIPAVSRSSSVNEKNALLAGAVSVTLIAMGAGAVILLGAGEWLFKLIRSDPDTLYAYQPSKLIWLLLPYYFFSALNLLGYSSLQAEKRFHENAVIPIVSPLVVIIALLLLPGSLNVSVLALAVSTGVFAEFLTLVLILRRFNLHLTTAGPITPLIGDVGVAKHATWFVPSTLILSAMPIIDQAIASGLGEGANATLAYGQRIPAAINGLAAAAVGVAVLPFFSAAIGRHGPEALAVMLARQTWRLLTLALAVSVFLAVSSPWIVKLIYERGAFDSHATGSVAAVQGAYFMQLPGMIVGMLYTRAVVAQGRARMLATLTAFTVLTQAALSWVFSAWIGLSGLGIAAALTSALNAVALIILVLGRKPSAWIGFPNRK